MRQMTAITLFGLVLLMLFTASRFPDGAEPGAAQRTQHKSGPFTGRAPVATERLRANELPRDNTSKAGGIWFW